MKVEIGPYPEKLSERQLVVIQIDPWDTWNMDSTLAMIILPMLKQLKETKHGSPSIDNEDLPEEMKTTGPDTLDAQLYFDFEDDYERLHWEQYELRWNWVLDEMIWAFEQKNTDWDDQYLTSPNVDFEGWSKHNKRMQNGFRLFGKYFDGLWD